MPPNNNAIPPRKEVTGQPALPLARVKKIIGTDPDIGICSNNAAFVITLATEMFIQYLAAEGHNMAKAERKPRRNVQYKDLSTAVNHHDNLEFLEDVIPKTVPYKQIKDSAAAARLNPRKADQEPKKRQSTLKTKGANAGASSSGNSNGVNGTAAAAALDPVTAVIHSDDPSAQLVAEARRAAGDEDVDMTG
ncbi:histone-like transcription factor and archaeal histone [Colletotrichum paranaense]|uniref:Histone-like transcription factor and archaeal histone n=2 Tax=Colletotrichum acutatum species complex TaxID=2707335 RepID=A0AAI9UW27_9PEZI|nr:histone-like transcription factor and archaeal histone [Colletotrichum paranaense]XP_060389755.1 histone-like transcription factor and archaeal histone [Colletotrichum abscissum]KAK1465801.1 histone-like transcription factor and archaeal histone [Colletotrichum melonis]KAK1472080.1 histone-like transcription factor and archaeal histone [Colletotrichum abscissum]KAK1531370.1 histone-like transcription factor and archaeal histone [Colletotrichum paranaense]